MEIKDVEASLTRQILAGTAVEGLYDCGLQFVVAKISSTHAGKIEFEWFSHSIPFENDTE